MTPTQVTLLTVGDPQRVTGGYLFHRRLADRAPHHGAEMTFVSIPDVPLPWAIAHGSGLVAGAGDPERRRARARQPGRDRGRAMDRPGRSARRRDAPSAARRDRTRTASPARSARRSTAMRTGRAACSSSRASGWPSSWLPAASPRGKLRVVVPGKDLDAQTAGESDIHADRARAAPRRTAHGGR